MDFTRCYSCMRELDRPGRRCPHCGFDNAAAAKTQSSHVLPCGYLLHGRYVIGKMLGQGGFGVTYIGWDLALELRVCIKEYFPAGAAMRSSAMSTTVTWSGGENAEELKRGRESFIKEARKAVKLRKLNAVVQVWDVFYENDTAYLVMDYVDGVTLKNHLIDTRRPLSEEECVRLFMPVMQDLEEVHARGIIHRDISPDNLMLQPDGSLVLLDIGAAKDLSGGNGQSSVLVAKKGFSPLEQYASGGDIGPWTDVYALCATIVYCVTGKLLPAPIDRLTGAELDLSAFSPPFAEVLQKGLAIRPEERIQNISELKNQLEEALQPVEVSASESGSKTELSERVVLNDETQSTLIDQLKRAPRPKTKNLIGWIIAAAAVICILLAIGRAETLDGNNQTRSAAQTFLPEKPLHTWETTEGLTYNIYNRYATIASFDNSQTTVVIPHAVGDKPVTGIEAKAFYFCSKLFEITIPEGIASIGDRAFAYCRSLKNITLPGSLISIGDFAFYDCSGLNSITIPESVARIGNSAFQGCDGLHDIYYSGTQAQWKKTDIGERNDALLNATIHFNA